MKLFISTASAERHATKSIAGKPGWSFDVVRRTIRNPDNSADIAFGVVLRGPNRLSLGWL